MHREMSAHLVVDVTSPATLAFELAVCTQHAATEALTVSIDGEFVQPRTVLDHHGTRLHVLDAGVGRVLLDYTATIDGRVEPQATDEADLLRYLRRSRYCESDSLAPTANAEFAGLTG